MAMSLLQRAERAEAERKRQLAATNGTRPVEPPLAAGVLDQWKLVQRTFSSFLALKKEIGRPLAVADAALDAYNEIATLRLEMLNTKGSTNVGASDRDIDKWSAAMRASQQQFMNALGAIDAFELQLTTSRRALWQALALGNAAASSPPSPSSRGSDGWPHRVLWAQPLAQLNTIYSVTIPTINGAETDITVFGSRDKKLTISLTTDTGHKVIAVPVINNNRHTRIMTKLPAGHYTFLLTLDPHMEAKSNGVTGSRTKKKRGIAGKSGHSSMASSSNGSMLLHHHHHAAGSDTRGTREGEVLPSFIVITSSQSVRMSQLVESARLRYRHVELRHQQQVWHDTLATRRALLAQPLYVPLRAFDVKAIDGIRAMPEALRQFEKVRASFDQSEQQRDAIRTVLAVDVWQIVLEYLRYLPPLPVLRCMVPDDSADDLYDTKSNDTDDEKPNNVRAAAENRSRRRRTGRADDDRRGNETTRATGAASSSSTHGVGRKKQRDEGLQSISFTVSKRVDASSSGGTTDSCDSIITLWSNGACAVVVYERHDRSRGDAFETTSYAGGFVFEEAKSGTTLKDTTSSLPSATNTSTNGTTAATTNSDASSTGAVANISRRRRERNELPTLANGHAIIDGEDEAKRYELHQASLHGGWILKLNVMKFHGKNRYYGDYAEGLSRATKDAMDDTGAVRATYVPCSELKLELAFNTSLAGLVAGTRSGSYMCGMGVAECFVVGPEPGHELKRRAPTNNAFEYRERWQEVLLTAPDFLPASVLGFSLGERKAIWMRDFEIVDDDFLASHPNTNGSSNNSASSSIDMDVSSATGGGGGGGRRTTIGEEVKRHTIDDMQRSMSGSPKLIHPSRMITDSPASMNRRRGTERKIQLSSSLQASPAGSPVMTPLPSLSPKASPPHFGLSSNFSLASPNGSPSGHSSSFFADDRKSMVGNGSSSMASLINNSTGMTINSNGHSNGSAPQSPVTSSSSMNTSGSSGKIGNGSNSGTTPTGGSVALANRAMARATNRSSMDRGTSAHRSSSRGSGVRSSVTYNPDSPNGTPLSSSLLRDTQAATTSGGSNGNNGGVTSNTSTTTSSGSRRSTATAAMNMNMGMGGNGTPPSRFPPIRASPGALPPLAGATASNNNTAIPSKRSVVIPAKPRGTLSGMNNGPSRAL